MKIASERPLARSIIKTAFQLFGGDHSHAHNWFPGLSIVGAPGAPDRLICYRGKRIAALQGSGALTASAGSDICIVGSGPSVRGIDLTSLEPRQAILLNGAIGLAGEGVEPLAIAVEDERFVWRHHQLMRENVRGDGLCLFSVGVLRALCEVDAAWVANRRVILIDDLRKPYGARKRSFAEAAALPFAYTDGSAAGLSTEPDLGVFQGGSVAVSAVQFAIHCRPCRIGLVGIDISNANLPRFYETDGHMARSGIARAEERILAHFALAKRYCDEKGISAVCHSPVSALLKCGYPYDARFSRHQ
ncbi:glycosyl transferase [Mycoplana ramosa]|uniref:Glycosyl transferase n=1 Tax=Mycoplana ramosa TaxID=40837 RepID=A0ABW3Z040_MYCRA